MMFLKKHWKRILGYALILAAVLAVLFSAAVIVILFSCGPKFTRHVGHVASH